MKQKDYVLGEAVCMVYVLYCVATGHHPELLLIP